MQVLNKDGIGSMDVVIEGIQYAYEEMKRKEADTGKKAKVGNILQCLGNIAKINSQNCHSFIICASKSNTCFNEKYISFVIIFYTIKIILFVYQSLAYLVFDTCVSSKQTYNNKKCSHMVYKCIHLFCIRSYYESLEAIITDFSMLFVLKRKSSK